MVNSTFANGVALYLEARGWAQVYSSLMNYSKRYLIWAVIPRQKNPTIIENNHTQQFSTLVYLLDYLRVQSKLDFFKNGGNGSKIIWVDKKWSQVFNISYFLIVKLNFSTLGLFPSSYYPKALVIDDSQERRSFLCFLDRTFFYLHRLEAPSTSFYTIKSKRFPLN